MIYTRTVTDYETGEVFTLSIGEARRSSDADGVA